MGKDIASPVPAKLRLANLESLNTMSNTPLVDIIPPNGGLVNGNTATLIQDVNVQQSTTNCNESQRLPTQTNGNIPNFHAMSKDDLAALAALQFERLQNVIVERDTYKQELQWERELFNNPTIPPTDKLIMWETTPVPIKRGLPFDYEQEKSHACITTKAERIGISPDTYGARLRKLATVGNVLKHEYRPEHINGHVTPSVYIAPTPLLAKPKAIDLPKPGAGHGGKRVKLCQCGSSNLVEKRQIVCADCGTVYSKATLHLVNAPEDASTVILPDKVTSNNTPPIVEPDSSTVKMTVDEFQYETWLKKRIGAGQTIWSTGDVDEVETSKYKSHQVGYSLNIGAYLAGDKHHIYGSPLRLADGNTNVLTWDIDVKDTTHYANRHEYMRQLAEAGAVPVCWLRRDGSCHIELYFDEPVNVDAAYAWACSAYPGLKDIEECYPINQKSGGRVSWPLYHRIGDKVIACQAEFMFPGEPEIIKHPGIVADKNGLAALLSKAVTLTLLIPELPVMEPIGAPQSRHIGGGLLDKPLPIRRTGQYDDGLLMPALDWWYDTHSWDFVTNGTIQRNRFCSPLHGDRTASVVVNDNGYTATDYGRTGSSKPVCKDKFDWWILFNPGLNKQEELKKLIAEYRNRCQKSQEQVAS